MREQGQDAVLQGKLMINRCCVFIILCTLLSGGIALADKVPSAEDTRPELVFSTFPSLGVGELYERILTEAYGQLGYTVKINRMPGRRALHSSNSGVVDGEAARLTAIEKNCPNLIRVPTPVAHSELTAFTKDCEIESEKGWQSIGHYPVGTIRGYKLVEKRIAKMDYHLADSYDSLLKMLEAGRVRIAVFSRFDGLKALKNAKNHTVSAQEPPLATLPLHHYLHKKNRHLLPKIETVLSEMRSSGRLAEIASELEQELKTY